MPRKTDSNNPQHWLEIAATEFAAVGKLAADQFAYDMCRSKLAEILEKILKAELLRCGWQLEKTHDLARLRATLHKHDQALADSLKQVCAALAEVYFVGRYPGFDLDDPDWPAFKVEFEAVGRFLATVKSRVAAQRRES